MKFFNSSKQYYETYFELSSVPKPQQNTSFFNSFVKTAIYSFWNSSFFWRRYTLLIKHVLCVNVKFISLQLCFIGAQIGSKYRKITLYYCMNETYTIIYVIVMEAIMIRRYIFLPGKKRENNWKILGIPLWGKWKLMGI